MLEKTGTNLHDSAATHARVLGKALDKYSVDQAQMSAFLPPNREPVPVNIVHESSFATKVVKMDVNADLLRELRRELVLRSKIDEAISDMATGTYFPLSTQFENSILFLPSAQRFYKRNRHIIESNFPEIETAVVNAFVVPPNGRPYGAHSAGAIGFQVPKLATQGFGYPKIHMSFHCAVTPTPLSRQPLVVFEDADPDSPNTSYLWEQIRSYDLDPEEAEQVDKAYYLHDSSKLSQIDVVPVRDYLLCKFWEKKYASLPERASGYFNHCQPGDAVVFDNYKPHGDSTLPLSPEERVTIDVRCFSRVKYPLARMTSGVDLLLNPEKKRREKRANLEFLLLLIGYESIEEFQKLIYGSEHSKVGAFDMITDGAFGVYNKPKYYVLERDMEPHYEKCARLYDRIEREGGYRLPKKAQEAVAALNAV